MHTLKETVEGEVAEACGSLRNDVQQGLAGIGDNIVEVKEQIKSTALVQQNSLQEVLDLLCDTANDP